MRPGMPTGISSLQGIKQNDAAARQDPHWQTAAPAGVTGNVPYLEAEVANSVVTVAPYGLAR